MAPDTQQQFPKITPQGLDDLRRRIGVPITDTLEPWCHEATRDNIRHYAHGIGDDNPLWCDPAYAARTRHRGIIALPSFLFATSRIISGYVGGLSGVHAMWAGADWTWHQAARRNDEITTEAWLKDLIEHETRFAGRSVQQIYHVKFRNQQGELLAEADSWCFRTERDHAREQGSKYTEVKSKPPRRYSDKELADVYRLYAAEDVRGATPRYWQDVTVGEPLPKMAKGPMTVTGFIAYAQGWGGLYIRANKLNWKQISRHSGLGIKNRFGIPDCPERVHWEHEFATAVGAPGAYDYGPERCSWLTHHLTNWMGDDGFLRRAHCKIRRHNPEGDYLIIEGRVTGKRVEDDRHLVEIEQEARNQDGELSVVGGGVVELPGARVTGVHAGLDVLGGRLSSLLAGRRVGLLCHPASIARDLTHAADVIRRLRRVRLTALFAPEHGLAGVAQDHTHIGTGFDRSRRLRVHSLYGKRLEPTPAMLRDIDVLVIDLQDVGARYYTFAWTTVLAMRVCAREGKPVIVLDRPNPLGGEQLEGNWADPKFASFVGLYPLPIRHGMTIAELAAYHNETQALGCDLTVVPMAGWRREMLWEDTELPWVAPSPNMPTPDTARVYPGGCLLEGTNLSEGRGTTRPFEWVGAPYLDGVKLAAALERRGLPGVRFRAAAFEPMFHKWARRTCEGVQVHVTDWDRFRSYAAYLALIIEARRQAPRGFRWKRPPYEFQWKKLPIDLIAGTDRIRRAIEAGTPLARIEASWRGDLAAFARARRSYLLYR